MTSAVQSDFFRTSAIGPRMLTRFLLTNAFFVLALLFPDRLPDVVKPVVVAAILFLVPGLAWVSRGSGDGFVVFFRAIMVSLFASVACWFPLMLLPGPTSRTGFLIALAVVTNLGLVVGARRQWYTQGPLTGALFVRLLLVAILFWAQSYVGASSRIPALEDQDMETQGTAYGLINEFRPSMVTNRGTTFFFAHPLLLHFWIGASALITDDLERLRYYHESAVQLRDAPRANLDARWEQDFAAFVKDPVLLPTRTPNIFLGVAVLFPLGFIIYRLSGSHLAALGGAVLYASLPEIYVRSAYGGYMAVTNFLMVSAAYFYLDASGQFAHGESASGSRRPSRRLGGLAAFLAALADQKTLLVAAAATTHAAWRTVWHGGFRRLTVAAARPELLAAFALAGGFAMGWAAFAAYGMAVAPDAFISDHLREHIFDRLRLRGLNLAAKIEAEWAYPSVLALWLQFAAQSGWPLVAPVAIAALQAFTRISQAQGFFLIWIVGGAVGFSLVDWRQTKHLMAIVPPLVVLTSVYWASLGDTARLAWAAVVLAGVAWNAYRILQLMRDFTYIAPMPIW